MTAQQMLLLATCVYLILLAATTYFTRATRRRFLGALAGGLAVAVIGVGVEILFQALGFWHYPSADQHYQIGVRLATEPNAEIGIMFYC